MSLVLVELPGDGHHAGLIDALEALPNLPFRWGFGFEPSTAAAAVMDGLRRLASEDVTHGKVLLVEYKDEVIAGLGLGRQDFESEVFDLDVARTSFCFVSEDLPVAMADAAAELLIRGALETCRDWGMRHWSLLVAADSESIKRVAARLGWTLADSTLEIMWDLSREETRTGVCGDSVELRPSSQDDIPLLMEMAREAYTKAIRTRYGADPQFTDERTGELYAQWVKKACEGSFADVVVISEIAGEVVGFDMLKLNPRLTEVTGVGLGARGFTVVNPAVRGQAISSCHTAWLNRFQYERIGGLNTARVLINNVAIQRAVAKAGAVVSAAYHTYHAWLSRESPQTTDSQS